MFWLSLSRDSSSPPPLPGRRAAKAGEKVTAFLEQDRRTASVAVSEVRRRPGLTPGLGEVEGGVRTAAEGAGDGRGSWVDLPGAREARMLLAFTDFGWFLFNLVLLDLGACFSLDSRCSIFCYAVFVVNFRSLRQRSLFFCSL